MHMDADIMGIHTHDLSNQAIKPAHQTAWPPGPAS